MRSKSRMCSSFFASSIRSRRRKQPWQNSSNGFRADAVYPCFGIAAQNSRREHVFAEVLREDERDFISVRAPTRRKSNWAIRFSFELLDHKEKGSHPWLPLCGLLAKRFRRPSRSRPASPWGL